MAPHPHGDSRAWPHPVLTLSHWSPLSSDPKTLAPPAPSFREDSAVGKLRSGARRQAQLSLCPHQVSRLAAHPRQGLRPPVCKPKESPGFLGSHGFNVVGLFYFFSSPSLCQTIALWSPGMEPPLLPPQQEPPRGSLTHRGGLSPGGWAALQPEAAANSPLPWLTLLTPPFHFHA